MQKYLTKSQIFFSSLDHLIAKFVQNRIECRFRNWFTSRRSNYWWIWGCTKRLSSPSVPPMGLYICKRNQTFLRRNDHQSILDPDSCALYRFHSRDRRINCEGGEACSGPSRARRTIETSVCCVCSREIYRVNLVGQVEYENNGMANRFIRSSFFHICSILHFYTRY